MERSKDSETTQRLAIFCPADLIPETTWLADNNLCPIETRQTLMAGDKGQIINGVNIYVQGDLEQVKNLFSTHLGWKPQVFKVEDGEYFDA